jgi:adenine phosphoribosyltransferase
LSDLTVARQRLAAGIRDILDYPSAGVMFKDITPLLADPQLLASAVAELAGTAPGDRTAPGGIDLVAGIEARGFILAAPVALALGAGFVPIRKKGKLPFTTVGASYQLEYATAEIEVHTDAVRPGQRVLLIDDVLATGGTAAAACGLLTGLGAQVVGLSVLIDELDFLKGRDRLPGLPVHRVLSY